MYGFVITTAGEAMLARAAAGEALVLDAVMVGRGVVESAAAAKALNTLIDPVAAATSTAPAVSGNQISMTVEYRNDLNGGLEAGFALSEFGISAHVGDDPAALLYYGSLGDAPQPVKPASEGLDVHRFPVAIAVTGEVSVTLEYPAGGFLTEEDIGGLNYIPTSEKGKPGGVATLGSDGKVLEEQLPKMDYDPAGSAAAVQQELTAHTDNKENPHGVTAEQVKALPLTGGTVTGPITLPGDPVQVLQAAPKQYVDTVGANAAALIRSYPIASGQTVTAGQVVDVGYVAKPTVGKYVAGNIQVQNVPVGSFITRTENGIPQYYLVVHQGLPSSMYDSSCKGTWVLRLNIYENAVWDSGDSNVLPGADIFTTMAGMLSLFDAETQAAIKTVKIPYCVGGGSSTVKSGADGLECRIFPLSGREVGSSSSSYSEDGSSLRYFRLGNSITRLAYLDGDIVGIWWLRSPYGSNAESVQMVSSNGSTSRLPASSSGGIRPAFILDPTLEVDGYYEGVTEALTTSGTPSQAIALQGGSAGDTIPVIFSGVAQLSGVTQGQEITSPGVHGFGALDGWLSVFPYWMPGVKIATGSYKGTGAYGSSNPNTLIFSIMPRFIFIDGIVSDSHNSGMFNGELIKAVGISADSSWISILGNDIHCVTNYATYASLTGNDASGWTLKFYNIHDAVSQLNNSGTTYYWVAIG